MQTQQQHEAANALILQLKGQLGEKDKEIEVLRKKISEMELKSAEQVRREEVSHLIIMDVLTTTTLIRLHFSPRKPQNLIILSSTCKLQYLSKRASMCRLNENRKICWFVLQNKTLRQSI